MKLFRVKALGMILLLFTGFLSSIHGEDFQFRYRQGDQYRILGVVNQNVSVNGKFLMRSQLLNRVTLKVLKVEEGRGFFEGVFQFTQGREDQGETTFRLVEEYPSQFWRGPRGTMKMEDQYLMPVVRNVPHFPETPLEVGDTWTHPGEEVHDLSINFGIQQPLKFRIDPIYEYLGLKEWDGKLWPAFSVEYTIYHRTKYPAPPSERYPVIFSGYSKQTHYWNALAGRPEYYKEEYSLNLRLNTGEIYEFEGDANAQILEAPALATEDVIRDVKQGLLDRGLGNYQVTKTPKGVKIELEKIQFLPDSARLLSSEERKLELLGEILNQYPGRDLLVEGHTALAGTPEQRQLLAEERAATVGDFLIKRGIRSRDRILYQGWGATRPLDNRSAPEAMEKNRRVEITILEN